MIARIQGTLLDLDGTTALVELSTGVAHEVMLPPFAAHRLAAGLGKPVTLFTIEFLESPNQGATFVPRMAGFLSRSDRAFFELLTTVQGIGPKKALRVLAMAPAHIAQALAEKDAKMLQALPEIGKKLSETIVLELGDKVERFLTGAETPPSAPPPEEVAPAAKGKKAPAKAAAVVGAGASSMAQARQLTRDAVAALVALGENPVAAVDWVERVMSQETPPTAVDAVIAAVYRLKAG